MKEKPLLVVKTTITLYEDYEENTWSDENPQWYCGDRYYKKDKDFSVLRKGSILKAYRYDDNVYEDGFVDNRIILIPNGESSSTFLFESIDEIKECNWFEVI